MAVSEETRVLKGPEVVDKIIDDTSIDEFLDRDPEDLTAADYSEMVLRLRAQRAQFIQAGEKRRAKRSGDTVDEPKGE